MATCIASKVRSPFLSLESRFLLVFIVCLAASFISFTDFCSSVEGGRERERGKGKERERGEGDEGEWP